ncbi:MAG: hypothetical protein HUJ90_06230 [Bacteroidales bacterium]|nr:hypothetical protein [Bacteroidales bacterium]
MIPKKFLFRAKAIGLFAFLCLNMTVLHAQDIGNDAVVHHLSSGAYLVVTDFLPADTTLDVADQLQRIIDDNPHRTLYFPDRVYYLSHPICTPADPRISVSLELSNYAILKAVDSWDCPDAMVRLGGKNPYNDIRVNGSNYYLRGGIIDGNGIADGVCIESGRETRVLDTSIKFTRVGLRIAFGANNGSSDSDIHDVNIVGNHSSQSVGVIVEGYDNTLSNMRIAGVHVGVWLKSGGNSLRDIHPLYNSKTDAYDQSCGFIVEQPDNWFNFCYSDQFCTGFHQITDGSCCYTDCFCYWYAAIGDTHRGWAFTGQFNSVITNPKIGFTQANAVNNHIPISVGQSGGNGVFRNPLFPTEVATDQTYLEYIQ